MSNQGQGYPLPIYSTLHQEKRDEIELYAKKTTAGIAAKEYYEEAGMKENSLYRTLLKKINAKPYHAVKISQERKAAELTDAEKELIEDLKTGKKGVEDVSRIVAAKVFEKMFKYPDDFKFYDYYQSQMLKLKKEEQVTKNTLAMELINRMFGGQLPPTHCPKCGTEIIHITETKAIEEGEIIK